ncbi:MAG: AAA family ATPase [Nannocystaceae bacterium]
MSASARSLFEIERTALGREEKSNATKERLAAVEAEPASLREEVTAMRSRWQSERDRIADIKKIAEQIDSVKAEAKKAERSGELERAAELTYSTLPALERRREAAHAELERLQEDGSFLREIVTDEDIAEIVSRWTGVPVTRMLTSEQTRLVEMEDHLRRRGDRADEAVARVSAAVRQSRAGLSDPDRPVGSFLFLGPTGVGKTELAKALAEFLFDDERNVVRIDMSEYMEKFSVSRLIGSLPGRAKAGYEEGGQLTEAIRRKPDSGGAADDREGPPRGLQPVPCRCSTTGASPTARAMVDFPQHRLSS